MFAAGIVRLFDLRFSTGDVYPAYSTLRGDPLGTKALYYSLGQLPGLRVERNVRPLRYLGGEPSAVPGQRDDLSGEDAAAVFYLGVAAYEWPFLFNESETVRLETIMNRGGRVILAFLPTTIDMTAKLLTEARRTHSGDGDDDGKESGGKAKDPGKQDSKNKEKEKERPGERSTIPTPAPTPKPSSSPADKNLLREDLIPRWQVDFLRTDGKAKKTGKTGTPAAITPAPTATPPAAEENAVPAGAPPDAGLKPVSWHTAVAFDLDSPGARAAGWSALYTRGGRPVIAERPFGTAGGKLILVSDPYFFSNEALRKEPHPALLALLAGPCPRIIFDETHFGVSEDPGMMTLARRYHLEGALAALAVLALLFLWKSMVSLVPPPIPGAAGLEPEPDRSVPGRDSGEGFVNLLRRGVPPRDLLATCLAQWRVSNALPGVRVPGAGVTGVLEAIAGAESGKPARRRAYAAAYQAMCAALKRRGGG